ncbi:hypothetical protein CROQUDRAFT_97016 [Cronartium quercuum f. sp. fusiforme G11]|uniref:Uncharacterized protein n=1 Tax=Cronartium quercuum f. sp. fusiforme G11 TaxID=708437 RepID=A0A9P6T9S8_9BASI|nr:hypothetical protein CROQUDRAFT_97016 [Cronartium quercuum f. sp. fusiforme G11]
MQQPAAQDYANQPHNQYRPYPVMQAQPQYPVPGFQHQEHQNQHQPMFDEIQENNQQPQNPQPQILLCPVPEDRCGTPTVPCCWQSLEGRKTQQ